MNEQEILRQVSALVQQEHELRAKAQLGKLSVDEERGRLRNVEEALDQCWDLLRQRRARSEFGQNADEAAARPTEEVEGYLQ